jgi:flagellar assembly protein FliH
MAATAKYLFDHDFGGSTKPVISVADHNAKLAEAEKEAYRSGFSAAQTEAEHSAVATLAAATTAFDRLLLEVNALEARMETAAVDVAVAVAQKLAAELMTREPLAELAALAGECFRNLVGAPHVAVRVSETLYEQARDMLTDIARARGFEGRLVVLAEPGIAPGDCRIEWADGGIVRDRATIDSAIAELVARYLAARQSSDTTTPAAGDLVGRSKP